MKRLYNFFHHSPQVQLLLIKAGVLLTLIVLGLGLLPYKTVLAKINRITPRRSGASRKNKCPEKQINWAVSKMGRYIPNAKCLAMALTVKVLYAREGYPAELRIGVDKIGDKQIKAHAWVESQGKIVIGNLHDLSRFKVLHSQENKNP